MKKIIIKDYNNIPNIENNVACIGYFDCLHLGHKKLIHETINIANKKNIKSCLICFNPDPKDIVLKKKNKNLLSYTNRIKLIESFGIDILIIIKFNEELMKLSPISFINKYLSSFNINELICGFDFSFGNKGKGDAILLKEKSKFNVNIINEVSYYNKKISSTYIKQLLFKGNFKLVNKLLGYKYYLDLKVNKSSKMKDKYLIELILKDNKTILPDNGEYDGFTIKNNKVYITKDTSLSKNENYKLYL